MKSKECPHCQVLLELVRLIYSDLATLLMEPLNHARWRDDAWARIRRLERELEGKPNGA